MDTASTAQSTRTPMAAAAVVILVVTAARMAYHAWWSPFELTADEAHYWEWSRHLDWSYYSKGPGIALAIRGATEVFGTDAAWAIRAVPAVSFAVVAWCMAVLARWASPGSRLAPVFGAVAAMVLPGFQGAALLATIDAPFLACWALALVVFRRMDARVRAGEPFLLDALAFGVVVGVGVLMKYTMVVLPMGLAVFHAIDPLRVRAMVRVRGALVVIAAAALVSAPIVVWNALRGWPTVRHLLGHLGVAGSDVPGDAEAPWVFDIAHPAEFLGAQLALAGPMVIVMVLSLQRRVWPAEEPVGPRRVHRMLACGGIPILAMYIAVSVFTDAEGNWALPAYVSLGVMAAVLAARAFDGAVSRGASATRFLWNASVVVGVVVAVGITALPALERVPALADVIPLHRVVGHRARAQALADQLSRMPEGTIVLADRYGTASVMAYNLRAILGEDAPVVTSAMSMLGDRPNAYDFWAHTDPRNPSLFGRDAILVGSGAEKWDRFVAFDRIDPTGPDAPFKVGRGYRGPRPVPLEAAP